MRGTREGQKGQERWTPPHQKVVLLRCRNDVDTSAASCTDSSASSVVLCELGLTGGAARHHLCYRSQRGNVNVHKWLRRCIMNVLNQGNISIIIDAIDGTIGDIENDTKWGQTEAVI